MECLDFLESVEFLDRLEFLDHLGVMTDWTVYTDLSKYTNWFRADGWLDKLECQDRLKLFLKVVCGWVVVVGGWVYLDYSVNSGPFLRFSIRFSIRFSLRYIYDHSVCETSDLLLHSTYSILLWISLIRFVFLWNNKSPFVKFWGVLMSTVWGFQK